MGGSYSGNTTDSKSVYVGSIPTPPAKETSLYLEEFFCYTKHMKKLIPRINLEELIPKELEIKIKEPKKVDGNVTLLELKIICELIKFYNPKTIFEIGTFDGRTTLNMAANSSPETKVYTLDLPKSKINTTKFKLYKGSKFSDDTYIQKDVSGIRFLSTIYTNKIKQIFGDSATFNFKRYNKKMDLIFIDGSHAKEYVQNDTRKALLMCKDKKSVILWHDYGVWDGVTKTLNDLYLHDKRFSNIANIKGTCLVIKH